MDKKKIEIVESCKHFTTFSSKDKYCATVVTALQRVRQCSSSASLPSFLCSGPTVPLPPLCVPWLSSDLLISHFGELNQQKNILSLFPNTLPPFSSPPQPFPTPQLFEQGRAVSCWFSFLQPLVWPDVAVMTGR